MIIEDESISFEPLDCADDEDTLRTFHDVVATESGSIMVIGGLDRDNASTESVLLVDDSGNISNKVTLNGSRFAASASVLSSGPLSGSVLVQGGFSLTLTDDPTKPDLDWTEDGAELYVPVP